VLAIRGKLAFYRNTWRLNKGDCLRFGFLAIQNDEDIRVIDEEIAELSHQNEIEESRLADLREKIASAESHIEQQDAELENLGAAVDKTQKLLGNLRSALEQRLTSLQLPGSDEQYDGEIDDYVAKLTAICRQSGSGGDSGGVAVDGVLQEALAGVEIV
jgi:septal ring factor EnvC (AmiA/AmiB activator)